MSIVKIQVTEDFLAVLDEMSIDLIYNIEFEDEHIIYIDSHILEVTLEDIEDTFKKHFIYLATLSEN